MKKSFLFFKSHIFQINLNPYFWIFNYRISSTEWTTRSFLLASSALHINFRKKVFLCFLALREYLSIFILIKYKQNSISLKITSYKKMDSSKTAKIPDTLQFITHFFIYIIIIVIMIFYVSPGASYASKTAPRVYKAIKVENNFAKQFHVIFRITTMRRVLTMSQTEKKMCNKNALFFAKKFNIIIFISFSSSLFHLLITRIYKRTFTCTRFFNRIRSFVNVNPFFCKIIPVEKNFFRTFFNLLLFLFPWYISLLPYRFPDEKKNIIRVPKNVKICISEYLQAELRRKLRQIFRQIIPFLL